MGGRGTLAGWGCVVHVGERRSKTLIDPPGVLTFISHIEHLPDYLEKGGPG